MKKIVVCMSLVCVVAMMQASEKNGKKVITTVDQLTSEVRRIRKEHNANGGSDFLRHLETRSTKINSEQSTGGDIKKDL